MRVKPWLCPACHQEFIVDVESTRDTCPWCHSAVEERGEGLRVVVQEGAESFPPGEPPDDGADEAEPAATTSGTQSWWPFEHNA